MFPIIPSSHVLSQSPSQSINKLSLSGHTYSSGFWNIWTEDLIKRKPTIDMDHVPPMKYQKCETNQTIKCETACLSRNGCFASCFIPKETKTKAFDFVDTSCNRKSNEQQSLRINSLGYLQINDNIPESIWINSLNIAHDTYSNNALLEINVERKLRIKIVKNVMINEEILMWFSEEILAIMNIPFLTPANILGKNCYKCTDCEKTFENPNPLKLHISMNCGRFTENELWRRLKCCLSKSHLVSSPISQWSHSFNQNQKPINFEPKALRQSSPQLPIVQQYFHHQPEQQHHNLSFQQIQRYSAFQPVLLPVQHQFPHSTSMPANGTTDKVVAAAAAQLETIVSNMGTSKQGHICIYCGKLYSRKYGLKIHIRTHTGFKPLKCKYCLRPFGDPSNLNKHIRLHVQEKSLYKCNLCSKILVRRRDLLRHINIKHGSGGGDGADGRHIQTYSECDTSNELSRSPNAYNDTTSNSTISDVNSGSSTDDEEFEKVEVD